MTNETASFCALHLCQMIFQFGEVKGGISIQHVLGIDFFKSLLSIDPLLMKLGQVG